MYGWREIVQVRAQLRADTARCGEGGRSHLDSIEHFTQGLGAVLDLGALVITEPLVEDRRHAGLTDHHWQTDEDLILNTVVTLHTTCTPSVNHC